MRRRNHLRPNPIRLHAFTDSGQTSHGERICASCDGLERSSVHRLRERSEDERAVEARIVGERDA